MKRLFVFVIALFPVLLHAQTENDEEQVNIRLKRANEYMQQARNATGYDIKVCYYSAQSEYTKALEIIPDIPDVFYQLCLCYIGLDDIKRVDYWFNKYKKSKPDEDELKKLDAAVKDYKKNRDINWKNEKMQKHTMHIGYEYTYSKAGFERNGHSYSADLNGFNIEWGKGFPFSFVSDLGFYYIPYGVKDKSIWNFDTWKGFRIGGGLRYIHDYPMFCLGSMCFRYTGYAGIALEILQDGGYMKGSENEFFFNAVGYRLSSGFFISEKNIPQGIRLEFVYQGHWSLSDVPPPLVYKPYFGISVAIHNGYFDKEK